MMITELNRLRVPQGAQYFAKEMTINIRSLDFASEEYVAAVEKVQQEVTKVEDKQNFFIEGQHILVRRKTEIRNATNTAIRDLSRSPGYLQNQQIRASG